VLIGGTGNDTVIGGRGSDTALLGSGADSFTWHPGDGSYTAANDGLQINTLGGSDSVSVASGVNQLINPSVDLGADQ
jgi:Ca2+-binding RTX toxin-like protein